MTERRALDLTKFYNELLKQGLVLNREGIDKVKKSGGKIGTVYLDSGYGYDLSCQIELTPTKIGSFCARVSNELQQKIGEEYATTIFELGNDEMVFAKKNLIKVEGKITLEELSNLFKLYPRYKRHMTLG